MHKGTLTERTVPWSELSTIEIERHFQGSPTISDSDLELPIQPRSESAVSSEGTFRMANAVHHKDYMSKSTLKRNSIEWCSVLGWNSSSLVPLCSVMWQVWPKMITRRPKRHHRTSTASKNTATDPGTLIDDHWNDSTTNFIGLMAAIRYRRNCHCCALSTNRIYGAETKGNILGVQWRQRCLRRRR